MKEITKFILDGPTCRHCAQAIQDPLRQIPGVQGIEIDFSKGHVMIEYQSESILQNRFEQAFLKLGYACNGEYVKNRDDCC